ncbi:MAG TPA: Asp-tRNA(Asn)/Glu-tRNA(Gln) amidotransferase subunit GatC [Turneriella sp.]|nr:Asp-tRNA(Asn)/Glu-tRNA(Gln) amidotransferase subunit GatC [Turneriella sp.]HNA79461.1 Asp-tRNA(Asn)/Glu-tRNA(Gln) amidotransferase subunit GatC [Turneriella sp.]HNL52912.1 Asp-tRNA(Asn)/Glu-tRNA(Gln) amidotransferase subunit GatC [Turneriella sp.]HNN00543.1 Asp-tRNA(Asn)/Glu-tRNA(Gln) amidotransferase subunit GatC [Turneriella sp.]
MSISTDEVKKIASLSKLRLEGSELEKMAHDFNGILDFVAQIKEADTSGAHVLDHPLGHTNSSREDVSEPSISQDAIRAFAPKFEAGFFVVPRVIETEG